METEITLAPLAVTLLLGLVLPVLVGLVTKARASAGVKQAVTVVLSGAAALLTVSTTAEGIAVFSVETLVLAAAQWLVTIASYHGIYRPHDLDGTLAPEVGFGAPKA